MIGRDSKDGAGYRLAVPDIVFVLNKFIKIIFTCVSCYSDCSDPVIIFQSEGSPLLVKLFKRTLKLRRLPISTK